MRSVVSITKKKKKKKNRGKSCPDRLYFALVPMVGGVKVKIKIHIDPWCPGYWRKCSCINLI